MADWMSERRNNRLYQEILSDQEITAKAYNLTMGGVVLYGLALNVIICYVFQDRIMNVNPILLLVGYVACCFIGTMISAKSNSALLSFVGYNLVVVPVGLVISISVYAYGGLQSEIVTQAFIITMLTSGFMVAFSIYKPEWFEKLGRVLGVCLISLLVVEIVLLLFGVHQIITAWIGAFVFSAYIGYDFYRAQAYPKTLDNAVDSALDIYLDIINLFLRILRILGSRGGSSSSRRR